MNGSNVLTKIEKAHFITTPADIHDLTKERLNAIGTTNRSGTTYLRALLATTLDALGLEPRQRSQGHPPKMKPEDQKSQLAGLEATHTSFYEQVLKAIDETPLTEDDIPKTGRTSPKAVKTRRANFARSAMSMLRGWVRAGRSLDALPPTKVTKWSLVIHHGTKRQRALSPKRLAAKAVKQSKELVTTLLALSDVDKEVALREIQTTIGILSDQYVKLGAHATRDSAIAVAEQRPLKIKGTVFVPTATQIMRQQARPS